jgi:hypothetical protein
MRTVITAFKRIVVGLMIVLGIGIVITILLYLLGFATHWLLLAASWLFPGRVTPASDSGPSSTDLIWLGVSAFLVIFVFASVLIFLYSVGQRFTNRGNSN